MAKFDWLMKCKPDAYAWEQLSKDGTGMWDSVRDHTAKLNMKAMKVDDKRGIFLSQQYRQGIRGNHARDRNRLP